jgi:hypothetical protein
MIPDEDARATGAPNLVVLRSSCRRLNDQRIDLDRRIAVQRLEEDFGCYAVWQERQDVLEDLGAAAERLARVSATRLTEVRAKAEVLALLMRPNGGEPIVPQDKTRALTLSLTDDLAGLAATATRPRADRKSGLRLATNSRRRGPTIRTSPATTNLPAMDATEEGQFGPTTTTTTFRRRRGVTHEGWQTRLQRKRPSSGIAATFG